MEFVTLLRPKNKFDMLNRIWKRVMAIVVTCVTLSSCYSVRVVNKDTVPEPDPLNTSPDFYRGKKTYVLDTVIGLKLLEGSFHLIAKPCSSLGFHSFEYRVDLGGVLLSGITLGKKRKVKIKYTCIKPS
jgi:hypothetical protein